VLDRLLEASVQICGPPPSASLALDWTDLEAWVRPPGRDGERASRDPEAAWGHRTANHPARSETLFGYYLQALTTVADEHGGEVPELVRRVQLTSCAQDPPAQIVPVLGRMRADGIALGDLLADCGYSYRRAENFAAPARALGARLVIDLHPSDRGPKGTHHGAICANGQLYCPATPATLLALTPLAPGASDEQAARHDQQSDELARYKFASISAPDRDGYRRAGCPAAHGKLRCPLQPDSMTLAHQRPTILKAPEHPPGCCTQQTITVPPSVCAKTAQKHDYPSKAHRDSYSRRSAAERTFATLTDSAAANLARGSCRLAGLAPIALFTATTVIARNLRIHDAFAARRAEDRRRATGGLEPKRRRRRRQMLEHPAAANAPP
jgi:hypothetical protein